MIRYECETCGAVTERFGMIDTPPDSIECSNCGETAYRVDYDVDGIEERLRSLGYMD